MSEHADLVSKARADLAQAQLLLGLPPTEDFATPHDLVVEANRVQRALRDAMKQVNSEIEKLSTTRSAARAYVAADTRP